MDFSNAHTLSVGNTKTVTSADASVGTAWQGDWEQLRYQGITRVLITLSSDNITTLGGTFIFEFSEDGSTATITETRTIDDFSTVRDFDLLQVGEWFRCSFEPDQALSADSVFITTIYRKEFDGFFVRLGNQELEEQNAALPSTFAYLKAFRTGGKSIGITATRGGSLTISDELLEVARGNITGRTAVSLSGRNGNIGTGTVPEEVWLGSTAYPGFPTGAPETVEVFSGNDADNGGTATGALTVRIHGLATSASTAYTTEDITLNGTTAVASVGTWYRVNKLEVLTAGSGGTNAGQLTVRHTTTTANIFLQVAANRGQSQACVYTVPASASLLITRLRVSIARSNNAAINGTVLLQYRELGTGAWRTIRSFEPVNAGPVQFDLTIPLSIPAQSDLRMRITAVSASSAIVGASIDGVLIDD